MDKIDKEQQLRKFALSVIDSPKYRNEISYILSKTKLTKEEVISAYLHYDMDIFAYENEIYDSLAMRVVLHLHNLLEESWHKDRQISILNMLKNLDVKSVVDMGFGVPTKYVRDIILKKKIIKLTLVDIYDSAFKLSEVLLDYLDDSWKDIVSFKKLDMNTHEFV